MPPRARSPSSLPFPSFCRTRSLSCIPTLPVVRSQSILAPFGDAPSVDWRKKGAVTPGTCSMLGVQCNAVCSSRSAAQHASRLRVRPCGDVAVVVGGGRGGGRGGGDWCWCVCWCVGMGVGVGIVSDVSGLIKWQPRLC